MVKKRNVGPISREQAFARGDQLALWDEVFTTGGHVDEWARVPLIEFAKRMLHEARSKNGKGRHARSVVEQEQAWNDLMVYEGANEWLRQNWKPKTRKMKPFSLHKAIEFARRGAGIIEHRTAMKMYRRAEKREKEGFYIGELFLHLPGHMLPKKVLKK